MSRRCLLLLAGVVLVACTADPTAVPPASSPGDTEATHPEAVGIAGPPGAVTDPAAPPAVELCDPAADDGEVVIWHSFGGEVAIDVLDGLLADYSAEHDIHVTTRWIARYQDLLRELAATDRLQWPDIVIAPQSATRAFLDSGSFLVPGDCADSSAIEADLLPVVEATYTVDDALVALPYGVSVPVLIFDATEFRAAGLDPDRPPDTLDELLDASRQLVDSGASPNGLVIYDVMMHWVTEQYAAKRGLTIGTSENGRVGGEVLVDYLTRDNVADLEELRQGVRDGHVVWIDNNVSTYDDLLRIVAKDDGGAMSIHTSAAVGDVVGMLEAGSFPEVELGVGPMPGPGAGSLVGGNALWLVDSADPLRTGAAWSVASWLASAPQLAAFTAATGYVPATRSAAQQPVIQQRWAQYPQFRVAYDQLAPMDANPATAGLLIGPATERDYVLYNASRSIIVDGADIGATLVEASNLVNGLIARYNAESSGS